MLYTAKILSVSVDGMELASRLSPGPCSVYRQLLIGSENPSFRNAVGTSSALYKSNTTTTTTRLYYTISDKTRKLALNRSMQS